MNHLAIDEDAIHQKQKLAQRRLLVATAICFFCAAVLIAVVVAVVLSVNGKKRIWYAPQTDRQNDTYRDVITVSPSLSTWTSNSVNIVTQQTASNGYYTEISYSKGVEIQTNLVSTSKLGVLSSIMPNITENKYAHLSSSISGSFHLLISSSSFVHIETPSWILSESSLPNASSSLTASSITPSATSNNFSLHSTTASKSMNETYRINSYGTSQPTSVTSSRMAPHSDIAISLSVSSSKEVLYSSVIKTTTLTTPPLITLPACRRDEFHCDSGQCVPQTSRCDRYTQCQDKSDEYNCPDCVGFQCTNGLCLWSFIVQCNGQVDCDDLSDEINCALKINQRKCDNGMLISNNQWCDGVDNCYDNSDETNCSCNPVYEHQCTDIMCIRQEWVCDGYTDCISDETNCANCSVNQYTCTDYSCINHTHVCDGEGQCPDGADEEYCVHLLSINGTDGQKLQIFLKGQNYSVCSSNWTTEWSDIICRGLGHSNASKTMFVETEGNEGSYLVIKESDPQENLSLTSQFIIRDVCTTNKTVLLSCKAKECGIQMTDVLALYIAGGDLVLPGRWPWVVSLSYLGRPFCGGALINSRWVLTAGHCVALPGAYNYTNTPNFIEVTLGSVERSRSVHNHSVKLHSDLIYHYPDLTWTGLGPIYWDIALVRLERPVKFTAYISPICLPSANEIFSEADTCFLAGWGYLGYNQATTPQFLREAKLKIWNPNDCKTNTVAMETEVNTTFTLCAGYSSGILSGCQGDSGGPLMCLSSRGRWTLAGVMSSGSNVCGSQSNLANRFTKTSAVLNWIERIITMK